MPDFRFLSTVMKHVLVLLFCASQLPNLLASSLETDETLSSAKRVPSDFKKITDHCYSVRIASDLIFVAQELTDTNLNFWAKFLSKEEKKAGALNPQISLASGQIGFRDVLLQYGLFNKKSPHEVWIVFATIDLALDTGQNPNPKSIEMYYTVSTSSQAPFVTPMGISRCAQFMLDPQQPKQHPKLAIDLQSFGAKVMRTRYPEKQFAITTPMRNMEKIFLRALGAENVHIGLDADWTKYIDTLKSDIEKTTDSENKHKLKTTLDFYQSRLKSVKDNPILMLDSGNKPSFVFFHLKDLAGKTLLLLNEKQIEEDPTYRWYFARETTYSQYNNTVVIVLEVLANHTFKGVLCEKSLATPESQPNRSIEQ